MLKHKLNLIATIQSQFPDLVVGGSFAALLHDIPYKEPTDIDFFSTSINIPSLIEDLEKLGLSINRTRRTTRTDQIWRNRDFEATILDGIAMLTESGVTLDFKHIKIKQPYRLESEQITIQGKTINIQSKKELIEGIKAFKNKLIQEGSIKAANTKYRMLNRPPFI